MAFSLKTTLKSGIRQFVDHPQLWLTVVVAISIFTSYLYITNKFVTIAQEAQDSLINVRVGAMHDAFAPLASELLREHPERLRNYMRDIAELNATMTDFFIAEQQGGTWQVVLSLDESEELTRIFGYDLILALANADPAHSYTTEEVRGGDRFFRTARALTGVPGTDGVVAVARNTLSAADKEIASNIRNGMIALVLILLFLLLLFFRHARIIDYTVLYRRLKEVDQMKDDFVSMASHELRAPLTAVRGYVELLNDSKEVASEKGKELLSRIDTSAESLDELIGSILDVSRIEQGRLSFEARTVRPADIITPAVETLAHAAAQKKLEVTVDMQSTRTISADPDRLRQVVLNLVSNAIKYTPKGTVAVRTYDEGDMFVLRVSDSGVGMSAAQQSQLFNKFYRVDNAESRKQRGTGLGLWITKQIVEHMHGSITVESIEGVGSHFIVRFPLVPETT